MTELGRVNMNGLRGFSSQFFATREGEIRGLPRGK